MASSLIFYNCSTDETVDNSKQTSNIDNFSEISVTSRGNGDIIIPSDEAPILSANLLDNLGFTSLVVDSKRDCIIDTKNNIVSLPFDDQLSGRKLPNAGILDIHITIAKMNVKPGDGCKSCQDCFGFRCKGSISLGGVLTVAEWRTKVDAGVLSDVREQDAYVEVDDTDKTIKIHTYNDVDWDHLK